MIKKLLLIICFLSLTCFTPVLAYNFSQESGLAETAEGLGFSDSANEKTLLEKIGQLTSVALSFVGIIFFVLLIYGGFLWMIDMGGGKQKEKALGIIKASVVGLIIIISAYAFTIFLGNILN